ncbi:MAG: PAS domain-containing protein, partial [Rhodocyclaceae bacterium]|nr:PAS domain-containing protein [Rhodocyclaceae bacterium]
MTQPTHEQINRLTAAIPGVVYQFRTDPDGGWAFLYLSPGIGELYEVSPEEAYADHNAVTGCLLPEDRESHRQSVENAIGTMTRWAHEHRIRTRSGKLKWVRGQAVPERQPDGSVVWNGILIDVTERRLAEEAPAESENRFRRVTSMTRD